MCVLPRASPIFPTTRRVPSTFRAAPIILLASIFGNAAAVDL
jgi:hypothetical protein